MKRLAPGLFAPLMACALGLTSSRPARADEAACIAASEAALTLRQQGKLHEALKQLAVCSEAGCSSEVIFLRSGVIRKIYPSHRNSMVDCSDNLSIMCSVRSGRCISFVCKELRASR